MPYGVRFRMMGSGACCDRGRKILVCRRVPSRVGIITSETSNRSAGLGCACSWSPIATVEAARISVMTRTWRVMPTLYTLYNFSGPLPLQPGTRLGQYEIVTPLGAGGMGEVYRARDSRLQRDAAIKVLPDMFAADQERAGRFAREAQVLAALNHPHIAQIYGLEQVTGDGAASISFIAMELVDGEDLSQRIARGPIPLDEALVIARQIAVALEAAHDQGIVHRDLKPANVKIRHDGVVKVLDFGLAKAVESGPAGSATMSPTLSVHATQAGSVLGTAAYMAPEQARGRPVDRRADIWAFGAVLYEMLTGHRAFEGEDISITLAAVLKDPVDFSKLSHD